MKLERKHSAAVSVELDVYRCDRCGTEEPGQALFHWASDKETACRPRPGVSPLPLRWGFIDDANGVRAHLCEACSGALVALQVAFAFCKSESSSGIHRARTYCERMVQEPCCATGRTVFANALLDLNQALEGN
jgi:hypothetical protein